MIEIEGKPENRRFNYTFLSKNLIELWYDEEPSGEKQMLVLDDENMRANFEDNTEN